MGRRGDPARRRIRSVGASRRTSRSRPNWGGPTVEDTVRNAALHMAERGEREDDYVRIQMVTATKGKQIRASPDLRALRARKDFASPGPRGARSGDAEFPHRMGSRPRWLAEQARRDGVGDEPLAEN